jgi:hypothetical protein
VQPLATAGSGLLLVVLLAVGIGGGGAYLKARDRGPAAGVSEATPAVETLRQGPPSETPGRARTVESGREAALPRGRETGWQRAAPREPLGPSALVPLKPEPAAIGIAPPAPPPPPLEPGEPRPTLLFQPVATAAGRIEAGGHVVDLEGITVLATDRQCEGAEGRRWPCGMVARAAFRAWLRGRAVECTVTAVPEGKPVVSPCSLGKEDPAAWLVKNGLAEAAPGSAYEQAGAEARAARRGIFGDRPQRVLVTLNGGAGILAGPPQAAPPDPAPPDPAPETLGEAGESGAPEAVFPPPAQP